MDGRSLPEIVGTAFLQVHEGRSTDDVVIDDELNKRFLAKCRELGATCNAAAINRALLNLRKASILGAVTQAQIRLNYDAYLHSAEIAARYVEDRHGTSIDQILCDPQLRSEFDRTARRVTPDVPLYNLRKAALRLRKSRRLRPELVSRVADWGRKVEQFSAVELQEDATRIPDQPGIYLFFDRSGLLYVGEAKNLRRRVLKHLDHSDRKALARYLWDNGCQDLQVELHSFATESNGRLKRHRCAYESELINSRKPRFNILT